MSFPKILDCIVAEGIRLEVEGKATILGFYGVVPHVEIGIKDPKKPVSLHFILMSSGLPPETMPAQYKGRVRILKPDGSTLKDSGEMELELVATPSDKVTPRAMLVFGISSVIYDTAGKYTFRLLVQPDIKYDASFTIVHP